MNWMEIVKDSSVYQAWMADVEAKGRLTEGKAILLRLGKKRFGPPAEDVRAQLDSINELDRLESLIDQLDTVTSWSELLALS